MLETPPSKMKQHTGPGPFFGKKKTHLPRWPPDFPPEKKSNPTFGIPQPTRTNLRDFQVNILECPKSRFGLGILISHTLQLQDGFPPGLHTRQRPRWWKQKLKATWLLRARFGPSWTEVWVNWVKPTAYHNVPLETVAIQKDIKICVCIYIHIFTKSSYSSSSCNLHSYLALSTLLESTPGTSPYLLPAFRSTTTCECLAWWLYLQSLAKSLVCYNLPMLGLKSNSLKKTNWFLWKIFIRATCLCTMIALALCKHPRCRRHCRREGWSGQHFMW